MTTPIALVTGANRGLGRSTALALGRAGYRVLVAHRPGSDPSATLELIAQEGGQAAPLVIDLADTASVLGAADAVRTAVASWGDGRLDVLVNNAGIGHFDALPDVTPSRFAEVMDTNVRGTFFLIQALAPLLRDGARIVNVSSSLTRHVSPATSVYAASKAAVESLTRSLAVELGPRGIRVNTVAPGPTATDFNGGAMRDSDELRAQLAGATALGRVAHPEEIADAVTALVQGGMRWVTADRLEVSGGVLL